MNMIDSTIVSKLQYHNSIIMGIQNVNFARETLGRIQYKNVMEKFIGVQESSTTDMRLTKTECFETPLINCNSCSESLSKSEISVKANIDEEYDDIMGEEEGCYCRVRRAPSEDLVELPENQWHGYFKGYSILSETQEFSISENKKCIELTSNLGACDLDGYLRSGIRCFMVDLFSGTNRENQSAILRLGECELKLSEEYGFPVTTTLCARLSPRLQYTGCLSVTDAEEILKKGDNVILTTSRVWSNKSNASKIYVNARFLLSDVVVCDFILIGCDIQLQVREVHEKILYCNVVIGGKLKSRLPVLFPARCQKFRVSFEELQDITFAKEVGILNIISYIPGTPEYFEDLLEVLKLLHCSDLRVGTRIVLNEIKGCDDDHNWVVDNYDGFVMEVSCDEQSSEDQILHLCPAAEAFITRVYESKKPIIFDPKGIAENKLIVDPSNFVHIYYYPDKYVFDCKNSANSFYFYFLQAARFEPLPQYMLAALPYCDRSYSGSDSLARACVAASFEMDARVIFVLSQTGRMAIKISHFRPKVPIIFLSHMKSATEFVFLYHNIYMLYFGTGRYDRYEMQVYKQLLLGLLCAKRRGFIKHQDYVMFVYGKEPGIQYPDKYISYKFDEHNCVNHLSKILFDEEINC